MLLALKIWCLVILGFLAIGLIVGSATATSRRHAEGNSKWKILIHPVHLFHRHHRKAA